MKSYGTNGIAFLISQGRLTASHETIIWAHTGKNRKYYFDYDYTKQFYDPSDQLKPRVSK